MKVQDRAPVDGWAPPTPPPGWRQVARSLDGAEYRHNIAPYSVIISATAEDDGRPWAHFSVAHPHRLPTWDDLVRFKEAFLGAESKAIQVIAPRSQWVNIHPHCLHLFVCLDGDPLPDFTAGSGSL